MQISQIIFAMKDISSDSDLRHFRDWWHNKDNANSPSASHCPFAVASPLQPTGSSLQASLFQPVLSPCECSSGVVED